MNAQPSDPKKELHAHVYGETPSLVIIASYLDLRRASSIFARIVITNGMGTQSIRYTALVMRGTVSCDRTQLIGRLFCFTTLSCVSERLCQRVFVVENCASPTTRMRFSVGMCRCYLLPLIKSAACRANRHTRQAALISNYLSDVCLLQSPAWITCCFNLITTFEVDIGPAHINIELLWFIGNVCPNEPCISQFTLRHNGC